MVPRSVACVRALCCLSENYRENRTTNSAGRSRQHGTSCRKSGASTPRKTTRRCHRKSSWRGSTYTVLIQARGFTRGARSIDMCFTALGCGSGRRLDCSIADIGDACCNCGTCTLASRRLSRTELGLVDSLRHRDTVFALLPTRASTLLNEWGRARS